MSPVTGIAEDKPVSTTYDPAQQPDIEARVGEARRPSIDQGSDNESLPVRPSRVLVAWSGSTSFDELGDGPPRPYECEPTSVRTLGARRSRRRDGGLSDTHRYQ